MTLGLGVRLVGSWDGLLSFRGMLVDWICLISYRVYGIVSEDLRFPVLSSPPALPFYLSSFLFTAASSFATIAMQRWMRLDEFHRIPLHSASRMPSNRYNWGHGVYIRTWSHGVYIRTRNHGVYVRTRSHVWRWTLNSSGRTFRKRWRINSILIMVSTLASLCQYYIPSHVRAYRRPWLGRLNLNEGLQHLGVETCLVYRNQIVSIDMEALKESFYL